MPEGERPPVDWRKRHVVLGGLTERVQRLSRPDEEWLDAPAPSAAAPARGPRSERASVEEALRILAESRVKVKGVRYTVYEPKTLRLRGTADAPATVEAAESPVKPSKPTDAATAAAPEQEHTVEAPFAHAKLARSPRQHGTHALPMSPLASLFTLRSPAEVDDQWQLVQQQHLERKQAAAIKYSKYSATPGGSSPLTTSFSSSSSPRTLQRSSSLSSPAAASGWSRSGISAVTSQVSLTGVGGHYHYGPQHAAEVAQRKRLHSSSATRGGALGDLAYTPARDMTGFAASPRRSSSRGSSAASGGLAIRRTASLPLHPGYAIPTSPRSQGKVGGGGLGDSGEYTGDSRDDSAIPEATPPLSAARRYPQPEPEPQPQPQQEPQPQPEPEPEARLQQAESSSALPTFSSFSPMSVHSRSEDRGPILYTRSPGEGFDQDLYLERGESEGEDTRRRRAEGERTFFVALHEQVSQIGSPPPH